MLMFVRIFLVVAAVLSSQTGLGVAGADDDECSWSLVFDAGSSGTRLHIFKIRRETGKPDTFLEYIPDSKDDENKLSLRPGLSGHLKAGDLENVRVDIAKLLSEATRYLPENKHASTPVRLGATAGFRLLTIAQQDQVISAATEALSDKTINPFSSYGAFILSGEEEAVFG